MTGDAPKPDSLGDRSARRGPGNAMLEVVIHCRAMRIGAADHDVLLLLAKIFADAGKRPAGSDGADEAVDFAARLLPDFRPRWSRNAPSGCPDCSTGLRTA